MDEEEWLACTEPKHMIRCGSARKRRLIACACARRVWSLLEDEKSEAAVEVAERFAEGLADAQALATARRAAVLDPLPQGPHDFARNAAFFTTMPAPQAAVYAALSAALEATLALEQEGGPKVGRSWPCALVRDIVPYRGVPLEPAWLTAEVCRLAQDLYEGRALPAGTLDGGGLAVLADALEEAGCAAQNLLAHLRGPGPHLRGCWPLDLVLARR